MRFLWPDLLWSLLLAPVLLAAYLLLLRRRKAAALHYASLSLVRAAARGRRWRRHVPPALFLLATIAALVAAARPSATVTLPTEYTTLILAMDVSRSMQAKDVEPDRISAAQSAAHRFIQDLDSNVRMGIVSFAGTAAVVQTPTDNRQDLIAALDRFQLQRGTATGSGLILALAMLFPEDGIDLESFSDSQQPGATAQPLDRARKRPATPRRAAEPVAPGSYTAGAIVLLSDGRRTTGPDPMDVAKLAAERGVRVYTVGFGTAQGATIETEGYSFYVRLDEETLKAVAKLTGAEYFHAGTAADLHKVYENLGLKFSLERRETEITALFSGVAALLALLAGALSLLWFPRGRPGPAPRTAAVRSAARSSTARSSPARSSPASRPTDPATAKRP